MANRLTIAILCLLSSAAIAQPLAGTGSITGTVRDISGGLVGDAQVEVRNEAQGLRRDANTNSHGVFAVIALEPAEGYTVTVKKAGFAVLVREAVEVLVGEVTNLEFPLQIAQETTRISVNAAAGVVDQTKTEVSQVVRQSQILNLPINGRRVDSYVLLTPAVVNDGPLGLVSFRGIAGGNSFLTDGNDTSNQYYDENAGRTRIFTQISQDAVLEFQVLSSGYSAGFGRASGGIINTVTRSGSNTPYGTAYWFFRNRALNARDPYASVNPPEHRHQAGGSIGGKFVQDKLFYFFNTEIHRRDFPLVASLARPPLFSSAGAFVGTCTAAAPRSALPRLASSTASFRFWTAPPIPSSSSASSTGCHRRITGSAPASTTCAGIRRTGTRRRPYSTMGRVSATTAIPRCGRAMAGSNGCTFPTARGSTNCASAGSRTATRTTSTPT